ncbi:MAG TPA: aminopeptidase [Burkholderiales bacterium]|nr:aminopeptidase [Burkholderiales bacterium]
MRKSLLLALAFAALLAGCANISYYLQSVRGQLDIWSRQHDIENVVDKPSTPEPLRKKLRAVLTMREFASEQLGLPRNMSYRSYANLERPYAVWNVFAAPEFSLKPRQWCFLFAGCVNYRGYFDKADAEEFAAEVRSEGYDVFVGGVPAYSLLGYFPDPVLNTFVGYPDAHLARLIFHELAHQVVYVSDDSVFNESFAVAVEQEGVRRWLARYGTQADHDAYAQIARRREEFVSLVEKYRQRLGAVYKTRVAPDAMRARKAQIFDEMRVEYEQVKAGWGGFKGYDRWFAEEPNNALLASVVIYTKRVPAFQALLAREGGNLPRFYAAAKELARMSHRQRTVALDRLMPVTASASAH